MSIYNAKNRDHDYALIKMREMEIMLKRPQDIEDLFMEASGENIAYMEKHGKEYLSHGSGERLSVLQKAETLAERAAESGGRSLKEKINGIYFSSLSKRKTEALQSAIDRTNGQLDPGNFINKAFSASNCIEKTKTGKGIGPDGVLSYENYIEKAFNLKKDLWENEIAQSAVRKTYKKLSAHVCGGTKEEGGETSIEEVIASAITGFNRYVPDETSWNTRMFEVYTQRGQGDQ